MAINKNKVIANAQKLVQKGQFDKAVAEYLRVVKEDPHDIRTWLKVGDLYTKMGLRPEATATYQKVAKYYSDRGFHLKAVAVFKQILKLDPTLFHIHLSLAQAYEKLGLVSDAVAQYEEVAQAYENSGNIPEAVEVLKRLVSLDPSNVAHHIRIAEFYSRENKVDNAASHFQNACSMLFDSGRLDDYTKVAERLLYHRPDDVDLARTLARVYLDSGDPQRSLTKLQNCFKTNPRDVGTLRLLAEAFSSLGQDNKTISVYKEMAKIYEEQGDAENRQKVLETIWRLAPDDPEVRAAMGVESEQAVPVQEDVEVYAEDVSIDSTGAEVVSDVERIIAETDVYIKYGLKDRAINHIQQVFEIDPLNIAAREKFKDLLVDVGDVENALKQLFYLANLFTEEQPEASVYYLHEVLRLDPSNKEGREKIKKLGGVLPDWIADSVDESADSSDEELAFDGEVLAFDDEEEALLVEDEGISVVPETEVMTASPGGEDGAVDEALDDFPEIESEVDLIEDDEPEILEEVSEVMPATDTVSFDDDIEAELDKLASPEELLWDSSRDTGEVDVADEGVRPRTTEESASLDPNLFSDKKELEDEEVEDLLALEEDEGDDEFAWEEDEEEEWEDLEDFEPSAEVLSEESLKEIEDALEEYSFYMQEEIYDEARSALDEVLEKYPDNPRIKNALAQLDVISASSAGGDLPAAETESKKPADTKEPERVTHSPRTGEAIASDDAQTHFDLGFAYKEMGIFAQARSEFEMAMQDVEREAQCLTMMGLCSVAEGNFEQAKADFEKALASPSISEDDELMLHYELGEVFLAMGNTSGAKRQFLEVYDLDPNFREVKSRLTS